MTALGNVCLEQLCGAAGSGETDHLIVTTPLLEMPVEDSAYLMGKFVFEAQKADGSECPPKTPYALVCCCSTSNQALST